MSTSFSTKGAERLPAGPDPNPVVEKNDVDRGFATEAHSLERIEAAFPGEWVEYLRGLMADAGDTPEDLFRHAFGLYRLAIDARKEGMVVGAASDPEKLDVEFEV